MRMYDYKYIWNWKLTYGWGFIVYLLQIHCLPIHHLGSSIVYQQSHICFMLDATRRQCLHVQTSLNMNSFCVPMNQRPGSSQKPQRVDSNGSTMCWCRLFGAHRLGISVGSRDSRNTKSHGWGSLLLKKVDCYIYLVKLYRPQTTSLQMVV